MTFIVLFILYHTNYEETCEYTDLYDITNKFYIKYQKDCMYDMDIHEIKFIDVYYENSILKLDTFLYDSIEHTIKICYEYVCAVYELDNMVNGHNSRNKHGRNIYDPVKILSSIHNITFDIRYIYITNTHNEHYVYTINK